MIGFLWRDYNWILWLNFLKCLQKVIKVLVTRLVLLFNKTSKSQLTRVLTWVLNVIFAGPIFVFVAHRLVKIIKAYIYNFFVIIILAELARAKNILIDVYWLIWCQSIFFGIILLNHHELVWPLLRLLEKLKALLILGCNLWLSLFVLKQDDFPWSQFRLNLVRCPRLNSPMRWSDLIIGHLDIGLSICANMANNLPGMSLSMLAILPLLLVFLHLLAHFRLIIEALGFLLRLSNSARAKHLFIA